MMTPDLWQERPRLHPQSAARLLGRTKLAPDSNDRRAANQGISVKVTESKSRTWQQPPGARRKWVGPRQLSPPGPVEPAASSAAMDLPARYLPAVVRVDGSSSGWTYVSANGPIPCTWTIAADVAMA